MLDGLKELEYYCKVFKVEGTNGCSIEKILKDLGECTPADCKSCRGSIELYVQFQLYYFK